MTRKLQSHVRILIYRTVAICAVPCKRVAQVKNSFVQKFDGTRVHRRGLIYRTEHERLLQSSCYLAILVNFVSLLKVFQDFPCDPASFCFSFFVFNLIKFFSELAFFCRLTWKLQCISYAKYPHFFSVDLSPKRGPKLTVRTEKTRSVMRGTCVVDVIWGGLNFFSGKYPRSISAQWPRSDIFVGVHRSTASYCWRIYVKRP